MSDQRPRLRFSLVINGETETAADYADFIRRLRVRLRVGSSHNVPALAIQGGPPQFCDVIIQVDGQEYSGSVRFRLQVDNLYLIGYQMSDQVWYEFNRPRGRPSLIRDSKELGFDGSYVTMARVGNQRLTSTTIGLNVLGGIIRTLASSTSMEERARGLIVFVMMVCEGARFRPISEFIWSHPQGFGIPDWMVNLVRSWSTLSGALQRADAYPDERFMLAAADAIHLPDREIRTLADIASIIGILLGFCYTLPRMSLVFTARNNEQPQCFVGLPLLDMFSVSIEGISNSDEPRIFGTITISNGVSTRNVYNLTKDNSEYLVADIEPNWPPEAITAYGEISIDVKLLLTYDRELGRSGGDIETSSSVIAWDSDVFNRVGPATILVNDTVTWDAFNFGSPYDQVISAPLVSTQGSFTVNYAVMRDAVAATVFVTLREAYEGTSEVYGRIHAYYGWPRARSALFHRRFGDYASVERGHNLPLLKSVVAVPLGSNSLKIDAHLTEYDPIADDPIVNQTFDFPIPDSLPASFSKDSTITDGNQIRVTVSWSSGF